MRTDPTRGPSILRRCTAWTVLATLLLSCGDSPSAPERPEPEPPALFPASGHYYQVVVGTMDWDAARAEATTLTHRGMKGRLATITTSAENAFVAQLLPVVQETGPDSLPDTFWLGARQDPGQDDPAAAWRWITGEEFCFANWAFQEPNDFEGREENALQIFRNGRWNDETAVNPQLKARGYVVEYAPADAPSDCPAP